MADAIDIPRLDKIGDWPAPEERGEWFGAAAAEETLLKAYRGGRMHHAWLIGGPKGIGKATLAYRFARFALAHPDPRSPAVIEARDLSVPANYPAFRRVANRAHPNLLVLERPWDHKEGRYKTVIPVEEIRRTVSFFGSTGGEPGWRIAIVDPGDELQLPQAANALLKILEEPPTRSLFLIVAHVPGRLLPTIRSRCRWLELKPLAEEALVTAIRTRATRPDADDLRLAASLSEGSLRRAILLIEEEGIATYRQFAKLVGRLPEIDVPAMHGFADSVTRRGADDAYDGFLDLFRDWLGRRVRRESEPDSVPLAPGIAAVPLARWAEVWEKVAQSSADAEELNLDRKQVVLSTLMTLARATRM